MSKFDRDDRVFRQRLRVCSLRSPAELDALLAARLEARPRCATARYLLGCRLFDRGLPASGVRQMMIAHHADPDLESAALLVFAGLNWVSRRESSLLSVLLETWDEFRRPEFDRTASERALFALFAEAASGLEAVSPLARRLWRLPIPSLRVQIDRAVAARQQGSYPLLLAAG